MNAPTAWCHGLTAAHPTEYPLQEGLCMACQVNLSHDLDQQEGL